MRRASLNMRMRIGWRGRGSKNTTSNTETELVEATRARVAALGPHGQAVPGCAQHF